LGHVILEEGIVVDPEKIKEIMEWPAPKNVKEVIYFMGYTSYYRIFIEIISKLAYPITNLQKKGIKFEWSQKCQDNFDKLKQLLTSPPILKLADPHKKFLLCIDASQEGLERSFDIGCSCFLL